MPFTINMSIFEKVGTHPDKAITLPQNASDGSEGSPVGDGGVSPAWQSHIEADHHPFSEYADTSPLHHFPDHLF